MGLQWHKYLLYTFGMFPLQYLSFRILVQASISFSYMKMSPTFPQMHPLHFQQTSDFQVFLLDQVIIEKNIELQWFTLVDDNYPQVSPAMHMPHARALLTAFFSGLCFQRYLYHHNLGDRCLFLEEKASLFTFWYNRYNIFLCCKVQAGWLSIMEDFSFPTLGFLFYTVVYGVCKSHWALMVLPCGISGSENQSKMKITRLWLLR